MAMDGVVSSGMRNYGLDYKLNFGVSVLKIRKIASRYIPNKVLAEKLWKENTRELKIIATLLYPREDFTIDAARRWIQQIPNQEIREQLGFNLFRFLPYTYALGLECVNSENEDIRITGYWFLARHLIEVGYSDELKAQEMTYLWEDIKSDNLFMHNAVKLLLKNIGRISVDKANTILHQIISFKDSEDPVLKEIFHNLLFDFQYYHGNAIIQSEFV